MNEGVSYSFYVLNFQWKKQKLFFIFVFEQV